MIPVDYVSNAIIMGTAFNARKNGYLVVHSGSSHANPITWHSYAMSIVEYISKQPLEQTIRTPNLLFEPNEFLYRLKLYLDN